MGAWLQKYATATAAGTHVGLPMVKAGAQDYATGADWVPAAGDVKVSIDGGVQANITTLPAYTNGQWLFQFTAPETTGKSIRVVVVDAAPKAVEDQFFVVQTFGNALAMFTIDYTAPGGKMPATLAGADMSGNPPTDWLNGAAVKADAVTKVQAGLSTYAGGPVASVTAAVTVGTNNDKTGYGINLAQTGLVPRDLGAVADAALTVGDALVAAVSGAAGKETVVGTAYTVKTPSTGTVVRSFTLDSATAPTSRN